jgi:tetratricopeptide (TPR) repeat protein
VHVSNSVVGDTAKTRRPLLPAFLVVLIVSVLSSVLYLNFQHSEEQELTPTHHPSHLPEPNQSSSLLHDRENVASIMNVDPETMYATYIKQNTVYPDRTIIGAFDDLINLYGYINNVPKDKNPYRTGPVQYNEHEVGLALIKGDRIISEIRVPRPIDFGDALTSMNEWLEIMSKDNPIEMATAVRTEDWREKVGFALADFHQLDPRLVIRGLLNLDTLWKSEGPDARLLLSAVRGYAILLFVLRPDPMNYTDQFASRALALLAFAKKLAPGMPVDREEAFLSMILGYSAHATELFDSGDAEILGPADHAFRAYMKQDLEGLKKHLREDAELLEFYLLARLCREMGLFKEAERITIYLLERFPNLYPAIIEIIYSANLRAAKLLTNVYPLDLLARLEDQVTSNTVENVDVWRERVKVFAGHQSQGNVSFSQFEDLLARWEPLKGYDHDSILINAAQIKQVFRTLYTGAVYLRFNVLLNRWAVLDRTTNYVNSFANADPEHPLVMSMQIEVQVGSGNRKAAEDICTKVIRHPQASASIVTSAHYYINDELKQIKATPAVVSKMDSRPQNLLNLGLIYSRLYNYDFSEKFYSLGLAQNPYRYNTYTSLAQVTGSDEPIFTAMENFPDNNMMLEEVGDYFLEKDDRYFKEKAAVVYGQVVKAQPTNKNLSSKLAGALRKLKRYDKAILVLQQWLDQNGGNNLTTTIYRGEMARIYLDMGDPDMALNALAEDMDSYQAGVMMTIAAAYTMLGEINEAQNMYHKALDRYPQVDHVLSGVAAFLWNRGSVEEASELIAKGRRIKGIHSRWYFSDFMKAFSHAPKYKIIAAIDSLKATGATSWEISSLALFFAGRDRHDIALEILQQISVKETMARLELATTIYEVIQEWKGEEPARNYLLKAVTPKLNGMLAMVLFKRGHYELLIDLIEDPDSFQTQYREFLWLLKLMAWMAEDQRPEGLQDRFFRHYQSRSKDYYHAIGRFMIGDLSQAELLALVKTPKQRCEISYYIGFAKRVQGNFSEAAIWYQICRETLLFNNGEFHWASEELFWWAHMGSKNRHRLVRDDIRAYRQKYARLSST